MFQQEMHASPYMEKYVYEALYRMNYPSQANARLEKRFAEMVNNDYFTTLFEAGALAPTASAAAPSTTPGAAAGSPSCRAGSAGCGPLRPATAAFWWPRSRAAWRRPRPRWPA